MSNIKDVCSSVNWSIASSMSSKLEPVIWLRDTGHIGIHGGAEGRRGGGADGRTDGRTYVRSRRHGYKTKFSHIDGLPYFLSYGAPRARAFSANN